MSQAVLAARAEFLDVLGAAGWAITDFEELLSRGNIAVDPAAIARFHGADVVVQMEFRAEDGRLTLDVHTGDGDTVCPARVHPRDQRKLLQLVVDLVPRLDTPGLDLDHCLGFLGALAPWCRRVLILTGNDEMVELLVNPDRTLRTVPTASDDTPGQAVWL